MSAIATPDVTGWIDLDATRKVFSYWLEDEPTGYEYGYIWSFRSVVNEHWGLERDELGKAAEAPPVGESELQRLAASLAVETPHVEVTQPPPLALSGNLAEDVHDVCGLTWRQIADIFAISERAVAGWRKQGVPDHRVQTMEALRAIGAILNGGLGPAGVAEWLTAGRPSRIERLGTGRQDAVVEEALSYRDTPAT